MWAVPHGTGALRLCTTGASFSPVTRSLIESPQPATSSVRLNMDSQDAISRLSGALIKEGQDRYRLARGKTILFVRLLGARTTIRFAAGDSVVFRIDAENLTVEDLSTHAMRSAFPWHRIESVAAGEPESENSDLFQG